MRASCTAHVLLVTAVMFAGVWTQVIGNDLTIQAPPTFGPETAIAGMPTDLTFSGAADGDLVVVTAAADCNAAMSASDGSATLAMRALASNKVSTTSTMVATNSGLTVCVASAESTGDSPDDWIKLTQTLEQVATSTFSPDRTVHGASQLMDIAGGVVGDQFMWTSAAHCNEGSTPDSSSTRTASYTYAGTGLHLNTDLQPGVYRLCCKPEAAVSSVWTLMDTGSLTVIARPSFTPTRGVGGEVHVISFSGSMDGDFVSFQTLSCEGAENATTTISSLKKTAIVSGAVSTSTEMIATATMYICYATQESLADNSTDFVPLDAYYYQSLVTFSPSRTVYGSNQVITLTGGNPQDQFYFKQGSECPNPYNGSSVNFNTSMDNQTNVVLLASSSGSLILESTAAIGSWILCYLQASGVDAGIWRPQYGFTLTVIPVPSFMPLTVIAGMTTPLTWNGTAAGDFVVVGPTCPDSSSVVPTSTNSLKATAIAGSMVMSTDPLMNAVTQLSVCIGTGESFNANSTFDFVYAGTIDQVQAVGWGPIRTIAGANQDMSIVNGVVGDAACWMKLAAECSECEAFHAASTNHTAAINISASSMVTLLPTDLEDGTYKLCYQPTAAGVWTHVTGNSLTIIAKPTFTPVTAVAG